VAAVSALLFLATCVLWVRSYRQAEVLDELRRDRYSSWCLYDIWWMRGSVAITKTYLGPNNMPPADFGSRLNFQTLEGEPGTVQSFFGFNDSIFGYSPPSQPYAAYGVWFPFWLAVAAFAIIPSLRIAAIANRIRHKNRKRAGLCPSCGYDLRATPGRCPECGAIPKTKAVS
jgi:hypothetical protein